MEFISDRHGLVRDLGNRVGGTYMMLWFDRLQIDKVWPPPRRQIEWRLPFRLREPV
jgi:hypothetical protein